MTRRKCQGVTVPKDIDELLDVIVDAGIASEDEAQAALEYFAELADREVAGETTRADALVEVVAFGLLQNAARGEVKS